MVEILNKLYNKNSEILVDPKPFLFGFSFSST